MENVHLKKRIKREEEVRKHWQDTCKKKEEKLSECKKQNEEMKKNIEIEKQNSKKASLSLAQRNEKVKILEDKNK